MNWQLGSHEIAELPSLKKTDQNFNIVPKYDSHILKYTYIF